MTKIIFISLIICISSADSFSQSIPKTHESKESKTLSRVKLSAGYFVGKYSDLGEDSYFVNINYRAALLKKFAKPLESDFAFEAGVNYWSGLFPLYAKGGYEIKIVNNLIVGANVGVVGVFLSPIAFYGFNGYYLIELSSRKCLELEGGFHSPFHRAEKNIYYGSVGVSIN